MAKRQEPFGVRQTCGVCGVNYASDDGHRCAEPAVPTDLAQRAAEDAELISRLKQAERDRAWEAHVARIQAADHRRENEALKQEKGEILQELHGLNETHKETLEENGELLLVAQGVKHYRGCPNDFTGGTELWPCPRCQAETAKHDLAATRAALEEEIAQRDHWIERVDAIADALSDTSEWTSENDRSDRAIELALTLQRDLAAAREEAERLREIANPFPEEGQQRCKRCGRGDGLNAMVDSVVWERLYAASGYNVLCLWCMDEIAAQLGMGTPVHVDLTFAGSVLSGDNSTAALEARLATADRLAEAIETQRDYGQGIDPAVTRALAEYRR